MDVGSNTLKARSNEEFLIHFRMPTRGGKLRRLVLGSSSRWSYLRR